MTEGMTARRMALGLALPAMVLACYNSTDGAVKVPLGSASASGALGSSGAAGTAGAVATDGAAPSELSPVAKRALDSANVLFRGGSAAKKLSDAAGAKRLYAEALLQYRQSVRASPNHAAPWFGVQMVAKEQNSKALADSALAAIRALSPSSPTSGAQPDLSDSTLSKRRMKMKGAPPIG